MVEAIADTDDTVGQAITNGMQIEQNKEEDQSPETILNQSHYCPSFSYNEQELQNQDAEFKKLMEEQNKFYSSKERIYYLLSQEWVANLREYLNPSGKAIHPGKFNENLIKEVLESIDDTSDYLVNEDRNHYCNIVLKEHLVEGKDYIIVNKKLMKFISKKYNGTLIPRMSYLNQGVKAVEVYLKVIPVISINQEIAKYIAKKSIGQFKIKKIQASKLWTISEFKAQWGKSLHSFLKKWAKEFNYYYYQWYSNITDDLVRLWMLPQSLDVNEFFNSCQTQCQGNLGMYSYKIQTEAKFLEADMKLRLDSLYFDEGSYLVMEIRDDNNSGWLFIQDGVSGVDRCEGCLKYKQLTCSCKCKKAFYCCEECRERDINYHSNHCNLAGEISDDDETELQFTTDSNKGKCGLQNLGNTCFMNSALQCLSNCYAVTEYFLQKAHVKELKLFEQLGRSNPLSSEGRMAKNYGYFLKNLWMNSNSPFSPYQLKSCVGKKNPHFSGYQQQDSSEFLCFLLDGIHEDLNRVLEKPYSESLDSENPAEDLLTATKSWYLHKMRNQSIIVDKFHGMLKSRLDCPDENCRKISITFDPFLILPLPVPIKKTKTIDLFLIWRDGRQLPLKFNAEYIKSKATFADLIQLVQSEINGLKHLKFVNTSKFRASDMYSSDQQLSILKKGYSEQVYFLLEQEEFDVGEKTLKVNLQMTRQISYYTSENSFIHILDFKSSMNLLDFKKAIVRHLRVVLEKVKTLGEEQEVQQTVKAMDDEQFYQLATGHSQKNQVEIQWETNTRGYFNCYYCGKNTCKNCPIEDDKDTTLADVYKKLPYNYDLSVIINFDNLESNATFSSLTNEYLDYEDYLKQKQEEQKKAEAIEEEAKTLELQPNQKEEETKIEIESQSQKNPKNPIWILKTNTPATICQPEQMQQKPAGQSIYDCFKAFESLEQLESGNEWYCNKCKQHQLASKQMKLYSAPENLIIQLKRFKHGENILSSNKIKTRIDFPIRNLDLTNYVVLSQHPNELLTEENQQELIAVTQKQQESMQEETTAQKKKVKQVSAQSVNVNPAILKKEKILYDLVGVSNHYGNVGFGHYTAYCQNPFDQKWYDFDDTSVTEIEEKSIVTEAAYLLFYHRKK